MDAEKRLLEICGSDSFIMNSKYVALSFEENKNGIQLKIIEDIMNSEEPMKRLVELFMEKSEIKTELKSISKSFLNEAKI
jgi:hypothetical protein